MTAFSIDYRGDYQVSLDIFLYRCCGKGKEGIEVSAAWCEFLKQPLYTIMLPDVSIVGPHHHLPEVAKGALARLQPCGGDKSTGDTPRTSYPDPCQETYRPDIGDSS